MLSQKLTRLRNAGTFKLKIEFTEEYPNKAPVVKFKSTVFHPNSRSHSPHSSSWEIKNCLLVEVSVEDWNLHQNRTLQHQEQIALLYLVDSKASPWKVSQLKQNFSYSDLPRWPNEQLATYSPCWISICLKTIYISSNL